MKQVNVLSMYELTKYARSVAQEAGLSVQFSKKPYSYLHGKTLYLAPEPAPIDQERAMLQLRKIIHEVAHYTDSNKEAWSANPLTQESELRGIWNQLEDHRIEHVQSKRYDGDADILDAGTSIAFGNALKIAGKLKPIPDPIEQVKIDRTVALLKFDRDLRSEWMPSMHEHDVELSPKQQEIYDKMLPFASDVRKVRQVAGKDGTLAAYDVAKRLFDAIGGDSEEEEKKGKAAAKEGKAAAGHGDEKADEKSEALKLSTAPKNNGKGTPGGSGCYGYGTATPATADEFYVVNYANPNKTYKGKADGKEDVDSDMRSYAAPYSCAIEAARASAASSEQLAQRMRRLVQVRTRSRTHYGLKQGKLHGASLHRVASNTPGYSERVFKRKEMQLDIDSAVSVCIDMSGSMSGKKMTHAAVAAEMLSETVGNALGIPLQMYGFCETANTCGGPDPSPSIWVIRDFNERIVSTEVLRSRTVDAIGNTMGNNPDGDALVWGFHQLRNTRAKRKILFMLSDGYPASGRSGDQSAYLKMVVEGIEKSPIKLMGVGLMADHVREYYKNSVVVNDAADIEARLITLVDTFILQGK